MELNGVGKEEWWSPDTPLKPRRRTIQNIVPLKLIPGEYKVLESDPCVADPGDSNSSDTILMADTTQGDDVEVNPPPPSKKRKNTEEEINDRPHKKTKKKTYRPKVISQLSKRTKKSPVKSSNTPKPSTPNQKRSQVRKAPKCQRSLFVEDSLCLPFLQNLDGSKVELDQNTTIENEFGIAYNSMQSYQKLMITLMSCGCLVESRRFGANFPKLCKKKRSVRGRPCLEKFLIDFPFVKKERSKSFIRKKGCWTTFNSEGNSTISRKMKSIIKRICSLKKRGSGKANQLVAHEKSGELVPYKRQSLGVDIILDEETLRVWNLLSNEKGHEESDEKRRKYWEEIRNNYRCVVHSFISRMHFIQGDRRFLPWKGSVMDSVVGAFLTQNVSDHLSSSAFMTLAARFPIKTNSCEESNEDARTTNDRQGSIGNNLTFSVTEVEKEMKDCSNVEEKEAQKAQESSKVDNNNKGIENNGSTDSPGKNLGKKQSATVTKKTKNQEEKERLFEKQKYWDMLRKIHTKSHRHNDHVDSVDWEGVRCAKTSEVAEAIASRGQHNVIAGRIQLMLNLLMESNESVDLEWLRHIPPKEAKEYLLSIYGLGLKSVECIRLLTLHHIAFPVDVNVGRIVVRLGWVPLQPLPEPIQIHNLEEFPESNKIQQYLWPRLCTLDQRTLYELHYQLITFGKVFCTKRNPNCNACPMRNDKKFALPESTPDQRIVVTFMDSANSVQHSALPSKSTFIEASKECEPIIEMPASPEPESKESDEFEVKHDEEFNKNDDTEDTEDIEDIVTIKLSSQEGLSKARDYSSEESQHDVKTSTAIVALHADTANIPMPKMKNASRLKTERLVYVLTDNHPLLAKVGELESSEESTNNNLREEDNDQIVPGTLLIPCRTAMRGRFPLNGTYFQVNEVFADHASMINPINVPRKWLWNLETRIVYFGTGASAIMRGLTLKQIHDCFWKGFVCIRAMDAKTRASRPISSILHRSTTARPHTNWEVASPQSPCHDPLWRPAATHKHGNTSPYHWLTTFLLGGLCENQIGSKLKKVTSAIHTGPLPITVIDYYRMKSARGGWLQVLCRRIGDGFYNSILTAFAYALMSAGSAASGVTNLNRTGIRHTALPNFCKPLHKFCDHVAISIAFTFISCFLLATSAVRM
ncbi:hypothetical protein SESBI_28515 [Sesbania bispinosa]|nr:hypothetical protein SESBI_28515 [Sesbania bispinosa]